MAIELVQHHITRRIALNLDHNPHAVTVRFVADIGNAFNCLFTNHFTNTFKQLRLIHLIGNFVNDNRFTILGIGLNLGLCPHDDRAAPIGIGFPNAVPPHDQAASWKIRPWNNDVNFFGGDLGIEDIGLTGGNHFTRIMWRNIGCHTNRDTISAIHQQIWIFGGKNCWF